MTRRKRGLSPEDRAIWDSVARQVTPLHPKKDPIVDKPLPTPKKTDPKPRFAPFNMAGPAGKPSAKAHVAPPLADTLRTAPVKMDRKAFDKMARGKLKPEARIDLHGMTMDSAHPALQDFILASVAGNLRLVLVITGKGKDRDDGGPIPVRRGILRHAVPQWLRLAPLAPHILEIRPAHLRHGGEGAFYVYLRRRR